VGVSDAVKVGEVPVAGVDVAGSLSVPDEHPVPTAIATRTNATALTAQRKCLRMPANLCNGSGAARRAITSVEWVVLCSEGYTSSLAAASLLDLGPHRTTDVVGGYHALKADDVLV
jgi:hypothetical protein